MVLDHTCHRSKRGSFPKGDGYPPNCHTYTIIYYTYVYIYTYTYIHKFIYSGKLTHWNPSDDGGMTIAAIAQSAHRTQTQAMLVGGSVAFKEDDKARRAWEPRRSRGDASCIDWHRWHPLWLWVYHFKQQKLCTKKRRQFRTLHAANTSKATFQFGPNLRFWSGLGLPWTVTGSLTFTHLHLH